MPSTREQGRAALTYVIVTVMNQPAEDGPMAKSLTAAQIDNVEDLGTLLEADIENLSFIALVGADPTPMVNEESYEPSLPSSGIALTRIIPLVITGMKSREKSLACIVTTNAREQQSVTE
jgi:hypothetical protein